MGSSSRSTLMLLLSSTLETTSHIIFWEDSVMKSVRYVLSVLLCWNYFQVWVRQLCFHPQHEQTTTIVHNNHQNKFWIKLNKTLLTGIIITNLIVDVPQTTKTTFIYFTLLSIFEYLCSKECLVSRYKVYLKNKIFVLVGVLCPLFLFVIVTYHCHWFRSSKQ